jgi:hypothetical protein
MFVTVSSYFPLLLLLRGSLRSLCIQVLQAANLYSPVWHDVLFIVMSVVVGFLYTSIFNCPCLLIKFRAR